jgi:hypothetical protein
VIDKLEDVAEELRGLYSEKDGKFHLDVDGIEDTGGLKRALQAERKAREDLDKKIKKWEALGKTDEEIAELIRKLDEDEHKDAEKKGEWEKLRAQMNEKHAKELAKRDEQISALRGRLNAELVDAKATSAIAAQKGVPDLLLPHVQRHVKVDENFNVLVVDAKGDPRVNGKGEPLSISELVAEMKSTETYGRAFEGTGHSGGGTPPNNGAAGTAHGVKRRSEFKSERERAAFVDANGLEAYEALPA